METRANKRKFSAKTSECIPDVATTRLGGVFAEPRGMETAGTSRTATRVQVGAIFLSTFSCEVIVEWVDDAYFHRKSCKIYIETFSQCYSGRAARSRGLRYVPSGACGTESGDWRPDLEAALSGNPGRHYQKRNLYRFAAWS
ncbi:hypothetical protein EVAR_53532_1 [Eumeta japonica]|uniref:Uncharacterized protein n=1 Tax=Eumeta variegata TaxID=151549 RepID=A0A4C1Y4M8_EUMVA|nr:hypothetical protein EVAR_53532_1 [Eumeta japonica]